MICLSRLKITLTSVVLHDSQQYFKFEAIKPLELPKIEHLASLPHPAERVRRWKLTKELCEGVKTVFTVTACLSKPPPYLLLLVLVPVSTRSKSWDSRTLPRWGILFLQKTKRGGSILELWRVRWQVSFDFYSSLSLYKCPVPGGSEFQIAVDSWVSLHGCSGRSLRAGSPLRLGHTRERRHEKVKPPTHVWPKGEPAHGLLQPRLVINKRFSASKPIRLIEFSSFRRKTHRGANLTRFIALFYFKFVCSNALLLLYWYGLYINPGGRGIPLGISALPGSGKRW